MNVDKHLRWGENRLIDLVMMKGEGAGRHPTPADKPIPILLIEDNPIDAQLLSTLLQKYSQPKFNVQWVSLVQEGIQQLKTAKFDAILLDLELPDSYGSDTFQMVHAVAKSVPIIILSGVNNSELAVELVGQGAQDYLVKGTIDQEMIVRSIRYALERQQEQIALQESEAKFRTLAEMVQVATFIYQNEQIVYANPFSAQLTDLSVDDLLQKDVGMIFGEDFAQFVADTTTVARQELRFVDRHGRVRWVLATCNWIDFRGMPAQLLTVFDITERIQAEQQILQAKELAEQTSRTKTAFLANISHELRTPLGAIIGYAELLQRDLQVAQQLQYLGDLDKMRSAAKDLLAMINTVLDIAKLEAGKIGVMLQRVEINDFLENILSANQPILEQYQTNITLHCPVDIGHIDTDVPKLEQIFACLLDNAAKFNPAGDITLTVRKDGDEQLLFEIEDTGIGMPAEHLDDLFEPFTQADDSTTRLYQGAGLGLALTLRLCTLLNGKIQIESREHEGTTVTLHFPVEQNQGI